VGNRAIFNPLLHPAITAAAAAIFLFAGGAALAPTSAASGSTLTDEDKQILDENW
jgi:hypothetical protein